MKRAGWTWRLPGVSKLRNRIGRPEVRRFFTTPRAGYSLFLAGVAVLVAIGVALVSGFVVLRALNIYGDPRLWHFDPDNLTASVMSFLATTKYPPSLLYTLMTLGPAAIFCAYADHLPGRIKDILLTYGRAPLAFYIPHFYLIHSLAILLGVSQGFKAEQFLTPYRFFPHGYGVGLGGVSLLRFDYGHGLSDGADAFFFGLNQVF